jgi:hypothetical protein
VKKNSFRIPIIKAVKENFNFKNEFLSTAEDISTRNNLKTFINEVNENKILVESKKLSFGEYSALTLIFNLQKKIIQQYLSFQNEDLFLEYKTFLKQNFGSYKLETLISKYSDKFYHNNEKEIFPDLICIFLGNTNPAFSKYHFIFSKEIFSEIEFETLSESLPNFFKAKSEVKTSSEDLITFLLKPSKKYPNSILEQLKFIKEYWKNFIEFEMSEIFLSLDTLSEENTPHLMGPGPAKIYDFNEDNLIEEENFTYDKNWMPNLILLAKNIFVWLHQLSVKYNKKITHFDEIPDEELAELSKNGFTGIWLIGVWERSKISKKIKELNGDKDAIASAYSLYDYQISKELGGDYSYDIFNKKAEKYKLRIGCDMVPNHTGLDSRLMTEHPDWFINLPYSPFPGYTFNSQNLSENSDFEIRLEDHYFDKTDAAVVFQYKNSHTGEIKYIYHGNDGTSFPWNDTAQLNYLLPQVREAVINDIIRISKMFPIIRFDAAMTLAKKHIQRLWFPKPGEGGAIPSRSEYSLSQKDFDKLIPKEFWREVVDRISVESPHTLLLAEAFWMMEGYFVRTLGMHRVYNSAFMNMIKNEENEKYRQTIFNTIKFNPQILKRFVNFMSNPDEETAFSQFGDNDKFFGVSVLMSTMPGLPMFAHGQIEGLKEKYGMEYKKPKYEEAPNQYLYNRHKREIFPILKKRSLFSDVENFLLFDFESKNGVINDVFAYSNKFDNQYSLVIYNNKFANYSGRIHKAKTINSNHEWIFKKLGEAWNLHNDNSYFVTFKDMISGLSFIRNSADIYQNGLTLNLKAYEYAVYTDIEEHKDTDVNIYSRLNNKLLNKGTKNLEREKKMILLKPLLLKFENYLNPTLIINLSNMDNKEFKKFSPELKIRIEDFFSDFADWLKLTQLPKSIPDEIIDDLDEFFFLKEKTEKPLYGIVIWILIRHIGKIIDHLNYEETTIMFLEEFGFSDIIESTIEKIDKNPEKMYSYELIKFIISIKDVSKSFNKSTIQRILLEIFKDKRIGKIIKLNKYNDIIWFNKEAMENFIEILSFSSIIILNNSFQKQEKHFFIDFVKQLLLKYVEDSKYQYEKLIYEIENIKLR